MGRPGKILRESGVQSFAFWQSRYVATVEVELVGGALLFLNVYGRFCGIRRLSAQ